MGNIKRITVLCVLLFCFLCTGFSRVRTYSEIWNMYTDEYNSMDDFYKYWNEAASDFRCVTIEFYEEVNFSGRHGPSSFELGDGSKRWFYYETRAPKMQALVAEFNDARYKNESNTRHGKKMFFLPTEYKQAVAYWNSLIEKM